MREIAVVHNIKVNDDAEIDFKKIFEMDMEDSWYL